MARREGARALLAVATALAVVGALVIVLRPPAALAEDQSNDVYPEVWCGTGDTREEAWHWVHNQVPDGVTSATLTARFEVLTGPNTGDVIELTVEGVIDNVIHYDLYYPEGLKLLPTPYDDVEGGKLVLSHWPECDQSSTTSSSTSSTSSSSSSSTSSTTTSSLHVFDQFDFVYELHVFDQFDFVYELHVFDQFDFVYELHVFDQFDFVYELHVFDQFDFVYEFHVFDQFDFVYEFHVFDLDEHDRADNEHHGTDDKHHRPVDHDHSRRGGALGCDHHVYRGRGSRHRGAPFHRRRNGNDGTSGRGTPRHRDSHAGHHEGTQRLGGRLTDHVVEAPDGRLRLGREGREAPGLTSRGFSMEYSAAIDYLNGHIGHGVKPGLDRIRGLLDAMGNPEHGYPIIHVAGTNGKTSTSRLATWLLIAHGLTTGTYTSPHLQRVEERLALNGAYSTPDQFALAVSDVAAFADILESRGGDPHTYFELTTASAFAFFADQAVDIAVLEVGLGGRLDATNVVDGEVCVVTSIGIEHTEYLGDDVASIASEKLGILSPGSILVTGPLPDAARERAEETARELGIQHRQYGRDFSVLDGQIGVGGWLTTIAGAESTYEDVFLPVHGRHQLVNLAVAIASVEALIGRKLDSDAVADAAAAVSLPGRMEPIGANPLVMLDGAHNADGVATLVSSLEEEFPSARWQVVLGVMGDKNLDAMLSHLEPITDGVVATAADSQRSVTPGQLAEEVGTFGLPVLAADDVPHALDMARAEAGPDGHVLVAGSLYLVGEARDALIG